MSERYWSSLRSFLIENGNYLNGGSDGSSGGASPSDTAATAPTQASTTGPSLLQMAEAPVSTPVAEPNSQASVGAQADLAPQTGLGPTANATTTGHIYYVATNGSDGNAG